MYAAFDLSIDDSQIDLYESGLEAYIKYKNEINLVLERFILEEGIPNGSKMQGDWFPLIDADIFISHSHKDEKRAIALSNWLWRNFKIRAFVDSCVWGNANSLLKLIDDKYCIHSNGVSYDYDKRNFSTSHVHMMLATSLSKMIDKTECLFFLNTNNSIKADSLISKTESPWIYHEISMTEIIRQLIPERLKEGKLRLYSTKYKNYVNESFRPEYELNLKHLTKIDMRVLDDWNTQKFATAQKALDYLYTERK